MNQYDRLSHLEKTWLPMPPLSSDILHIFKTQIHRHEDASLSGEEEYADEVINPHLIILDKFKSINDGLGYNIGDLVLQNVASRLLNLVRPGDTVACMGGDELTLIRNDLHSAEDAENIADKIVQRIAAPFTFGDTSCNPGASIGITFFPDHDIIAEQLINRADQSMYLAKAEGRNTYCFYHEQSASKKS